MARDDQNAWFDAMLMVPPEWRAEFSRFAETGEASDEFLSFAAGNHRCREALEKALRADSAIVAFIKIACGEPEGRAARPRSARDGN
jgi:hypothetical protein